jgi:cytochrome c-type biogenesis protein CcmE
MREPVKQRIIKLLIGASIIFVAVLIIIFNLRDNLIYFYSPTDLVEINLNNNQEIRVGGLVADNSLKYEENSSIYRFVITDEKNIINVEYRGILPNLFAENKGVVVEGVYSGANNIIANKVLAKHDENYMPPEVIDALQKEGKWQGE